MASPIALSFGSAIAWPIATGAWKRDGAWYPTVLSSNIQCALDKKRDTQYYAPSTLNDLPVLKPLETYGTFRAPRAGRCWLFDGSDDYARLASALTLSGALTISLWFKRSTADTGVALLGYSGNLANVLRIYQDTQIDIFDADGNRVAFDVPTLFASTWVNLVVTRDGSGNTRLYIDGTESTSGSKSLAAAVVLDQLGCRADAQDYFPGSVYDVRIYNVQKSAAEVAAIYNQADTPETIDTTGLVAGWWCNEESGLTGYDWSGNGKNLTLTNITQATFHASDAGVKYNPANWLGYTLSGFVIIPRNESDTAKDVSGATLGKNGRCPHPVVVETPCIKLSAGVELRFPDIAASFTTEGTIAIRLKGDTGEDINFTPGFGTAVSDDWYPFSGSNAYSSYFRNSRVGPFSMVNTTDWGWLIVTTKPGANGWNIYQDGTKIGTATGESVITLPSVPKIAPLNAFVLVADVAIWNRELTSGELSALVNSYTIPQSGLVVHIPSQDGPGDSSTNRTVRDVSGNGNDCTLVNGTVSTIWGTRCPGYAQDWSVNYGGRLTNQNLIRYSNELENLAWNKVNSTFSGDTLTDDATNGGHSVQFPETTATAQPYVMSVEAKAGTMSRCMLYSLNADGRGYGFDLSNGTTFAVSGIAAPTSYEITSIGDGWYRCSIVFNGTAGTQNYGAVYLVSGTNFSYSGTGQTLHLRNAQLNESELQPYQPTGATAVPANVFVPGNVSGANCVDGFAKTLIAGKHGNPYSRIVPNYWSAPELVNIGSTSSDKYAPGYDVQSESVADTRYRRTAVSGDDRLLAFSAALSGTNKVKAQTYTT